jgi:hypothetical protein
MTTHLYSIVGISYRPDSPKNPSPAFAIVQFLPVGAELRLIAEPTNEADPNAIAVFIDPLDSVWNLTPKTEYLDRLESAMLSLGPRFTLDWLLQQQLVQLGYLSATVAKELKPTWSNRSGHFALGANGGPKVRFEL